MEDTLTKIKDKEKEFGELWGRIQKDRQRILSEENPYVLKDSKGKPIPNTISVTPNDAEIHINAIASILMDAKFQIAAEGKNLTDEQQMNIEGFLNDNLSEIDEGLEFGGEAMLDFLANHICHTGIIGARYIDYQDNGVRVPDVILLDMQDCVFELGKNKINWVAPKYMRPAELVAEEYDMPQSKLGKAKEIEIYDYWDCEKNETYIDGVLSPKGTVENKFGYPPFIIQFAPAGFMFKTKGYMKHMGESLLFLNRMMYDEVARIISIEQTLNMKRIMPPLQRGVKDLQNDEPEYPDGIGKKVELITDEGETLWQPVPQSDLNNASLMARNDISDRIQRGGVNNIDLGNVSQTVSAIWITEQTEIRNKLLNPRVKAIQRFYKQLNRMAIDQFIKNGMQAQIGQEGRKSLYKVADLGDPKTYFIDCRLMTSNKKQEIANIAEAQALKGIISDETILTDILLFQDPQGEIRKRDSEYMERLYPPLRFRRTAIELAKEADLLDKSGKKDEAELKFEEAKSIAYAYLQLVNAPNQSMPKSESTQQLPNNSMVPLISGVNL